MVVEVPSFFAEETFVVGKHSIAKKANIDRQDQNVAEVGDTQQLEMLQNRLVQVEKSSLK